MRTLLSARKHVLHRRLAGLDALSPLAILSRGYSVMYRLPENRLVRSSSDVKEGDLVRARLAAGQLHCLVQQVLPDSAP